jgi:hypothetical protein
MPDRSSCTRSTARNPRTLFTSHATVCLLHLQALTFADLYLGCRYSYQNNYSVHRGVRYYYGGIPDYIQVSEHQFVEKKLVGMWVDMMLVGWLVVFFSASDNCSINL